MLTSLTKSSSFSSFSLACFWSTWCTEFLLFFTYMPFQCPFALEDSTICFADRGEGEQDWYVPGDFYNFLLFNFFFFGRHLFTHDIYPHPHPRPTTSTHYPRPMTFSYTPFPTPKYSLIDTITQSDVIMIIAHHISLFVGRLLSTHFTRFLSHPPTLDCSAWGWQRGLLFSSF